MEYTIFRYSNVILLPGIGCEMIRLKEYTVRKNTFNNKINSNII